MGVFYKVLENILSFLSSKPIVSAKPIVSVNSQCYLRDTREWQNAIKTESDILDSFAWTRLQNARYDITPNVRRIFVAASRSFAMRNPVYVRLLDLAEEFIVGTNGLVMVPAAKNERYKTAAKKHLKEWTRNCDISSHKRFEELQGVIIQLWLKDGECFIVKEGIENGYKKIRIVETHEIVSPNISNKNIIDGIEYDSWLKPIAYYIKNSTGDSYSRYNASDVIHIYTQLRPRQLRGIPYCYPIMRQLDCIDKLLAFEMKNAKNMSSKAGVVTTLSGEAPDQVSAIQRAAISGNETETIESAAETAKRIVDLENKYGSEVFYMKPGEDFKELFTARPSPGTINLFNILINQCCIGFGLGKMGVDPQSIQGTVARFDIELDNAFVEGHSKMFAEKLKDIYAYAVSTIPTSAPDWKQVNIQTPKKIIVDLGRDATKTVEELKHGLKTLRADYSERGMDWDEELEQIGVEAKRIKEVADRNGIKPEEMLSRFMSAVGNGGSQPSEQNQDNKKEEPQKNEEEDE